MDRKYLIFLALGFELVAIVIICFFFGQYLDQKWQSPGLISAILPFVGLGGWVVHVLMIQKQLQ